VARTSAGILLFRGSGSALEVLLVHPGGPFWAKKDLWGIPKGLIHPGEDPLEAARREFEEETGFAVDGQFLPLGEVQQKSGKIVRAWGVRGDLDAEKIRSNEFEVEWPPGSGRKRSYPEIDRGAWYGITEAREKLLEAQLPLLDALEPLV